MMFCSCSKFRGGRAPRRACFFLWITSCKTSLDLSVPPKNSCPLPSPLILARTLEQWEQIRISLVRQQLTCKEPLTFSGTRLEHWNKNRGKKGLTNGIFSGNMHIQCMLKLNVTNEQNPPPGGFPTSGQGYLTNKIFSGNMHIQCMLKFLRHR